MVWPVQEVYNHRSMLSRIMFLSALPVYIAATAMKDPDVFGSTEEPIHVFCSTEGIDQFPMVDPQALHQHPWGASEHTKPGLFSLSKLPCPKNCTCNWLYSNTLSVSCEIGGYTRVPLFPNETKVLRFHQNNVRTLNNFTFMNLGKLESLSLYNNKMKYIEQLAFLGLEKLKTLNLAHNDIQELHDNVFYPCPSLIDVVLSFNRNLVNLPLSLGGLHRLCKLTFDNDGQTSPIFNGSITNQLDIFRNVPLEMLSLRGLGIESASVHAFRSLYDLQFLDLTSNYLGKQEIIHAFLSLPNVTLRQLVVKFNDFHVNFLSRDIFMPLTIKTPLFLSLAGCGFTKINVDAFCPISSLEILNLGYNRLEVLDPRPFKCLKNLRAIKFDNSFLLHPDYRFFIPKSHFFPTSLTDIKISHTSQRYPFLPSLKYFWSSSPNLRKLIFTDNYPNYALEPWPPSDTFKFLPAIESIIATRNNFYKLWNGTFSRIPRLKLVDLGHNKIRHIDDNAFSYLPSLRSLDLRNNIIECTPCLYNVPSLGRLDLSTNVISKLRTCTFSDKRKLIKVDLSKNHIFSVDKFLNFRLMALTILHLSSNQMPVINIEVLKALKSLRMIDLSQNPFACTCELLSFREWINSTNVAVEKFHQTGSYICHSPASLRHKNLKDFNPTPQECKKINLVMVISVSIAVVITIAIMTSSLIYRYRWYIRYWIYLARSRRKKSRMLEHPDDFEYDAFVSYSSEDSNWIEETLCAELEEHPPYLKLCLHERDFDIGKVIFESIVENMEISNKIIFVVSKNFVSSQWCLFEMRMAQHKVFDENKDNIVLVLLDDVPMEQMSHTLRYLIRTRTYIAWTGDPQGQELFWNKLKASLRCPNAPVVNT